MLPANVFRGPRSAGPSLLRVLAASAALLCLSACSTVKRAAVNQMADVLAQGGTAFSSDEDPELVKQAVPFSLKLMESVLAQNPHHTGLLEATAGGFVQYAYAFVVQEADKLEATDLATAEHQRLRAKRLFLRARGYGLRGLEEKHPGFGKQLRENPAAAVRQCTRAEVGLLYWTAAAWGGALSVGKTDSDLIGEIPCMEALIDRALALDESWGDGALHSFLISYEMSRQGLKGDPALRSEKHFERAIELSHGRQAGPYVSLVEAVCIEKQDLARFRALLAKALAIDPDVVPEARLANTVMQDRARWLLSRETDLFLHPANPSPAP